MNTKPWIKHYAAGVPASLAPYPDRTLLDVVAQAARERPTPHAATPHPPALAPPASPLLGGSSAFVSFVSFVDQLYPLTIQTPCLCNNYPVRFLNSSAH